MIHFIKWEPKIKICELYPSSFPNWLILCQAASFRDQIDIFTFTFCCWFPLYNLVCFVVNIFLKWFLICGLGRVGQKRWPSIYLVRPGSDHQQYLMSIRTRVFCQPPISCRAILFYWRLEYWYPWAKLCVLFQISLSCTLFNELVINLFGCAFVWPESAFPYSLPELFTSSSKNFWKDLLECSDRGKVLWKMSWNTSCENGSL